MPCPYFEPQQLASTPRDPKARLPLIEEYAGLCHADPLPSSVPAEMQFRCCNHGYSEKMCLRYPSPERRSCARFSVLERSAEALHILYVEERHHAPVEWKALRYTVLSQSLEPEMHDVCARAQALAFCRSYLQRFAAGTVPHNGEYGNGTAGGGSAL